MDIFGNFSKIITKKSTSSSTSIKEEDFSYSDVTLEGMKKVESKTSTQFLFSFKLLVVLIFCLILTKLFFLQVILGESNRSLAEGNRIRPRVIEAQRGAILDRDGNWLGRNKPNYVLALYPCDLPKKKTERDAIYDQIGTIINQKPADIKDASEKNGLLSLDYIPLLENISHDDSLILKKKLFGVAGVSIINKSDREYVILPGLAHILGYVGKVSESDIKNNTDYFMTDRSGKVGLESTYEKYLKGTHGVEQIEVDSKGNIIQVLAEDGRREPVSGNDLTLYLDRNLQNVTAEALKKGIESAKTASGQEVNSGVAIVMDVKTGGVLSMVSIPDFDNNIFSGQISNQKYQDLINNPTYPMFNRAIAGTYPPGSISKIILASAGLAAGTINKNTSFVTPAAIQIGDYTFPDWKDHSYESTNVERALAESNNVFFYSVGGGYDKIKGLGINNINKYWKLFGLGEKTGIDLTGEASGLLPTPEWKEKVKKEPWYIGDTYHASIGQGDLLVTPIQMLRATVAVANGGTLLQPQIVKKISRSDGTVVKEFGPQVVRENIVRTDVVKTVQEGMRMAVTQGSARSLLDLPVSSAGKTGTAQFFDNQKTHAWFECYAPYENPQIAVLTMVEGGGGGNEFALPIAKEILNYYFSK
jgi:penicillin-binding protein 2